MKKIIMASFIAVILLALFLPVQPKPDQPGQILSARTEKPLADTAGLFDSGSLLEEVSLAGRNISDLPIESVSKYESDDPDGWAILIPQTHKYPGSSVDSPKNDSAQKAQEQIYRIISSLYKKYGVGFIMVEGELYGKIPEQKIEKIKNDIAARNKLGELLSDLDANMRRNNLSRELIDRITKNGKNAVDYLDRKIILQGAPFKVRAENRNVNLFGVENKDTYQESAEIVRNYIYLQDRKNQLVASPKNFFSLQLENSISIADIYRMMLTKKNNPINKLKISLKPLESFAVSKGDAELLKNINELNNFYINLQEDSVQTAQTAKPANPYSNLNNVEKIDTLIKQTSRAVQETVIDRRNRETAENFARTVKLMPNNTGIIQFGAGHKDGLIKELNSRNISVMVIVPEEVANMSGYN
ncbi:hypothetical protein C4569_00055 [Candidatus Parcubacteria bacterium]|nr:MAG: hypothetical protein C4569_00055 [Candidatus Parcubacteria bacterium]